MKKIIPFVFLFIVNKNCFGQKDSLTVIPPPPTGKTKGKKIKIFDKVEREASFPGGDTAYKNFLLSNLRTIADSASERKISKGVYVVQLTFIVNKDGGVSPNTAESKPKEAFLELLCMDMIKRSPQWLPALVNGMTVKAYRSQPLTITIE